MDQFEKAERFAALHKKGTPLFLYNAWDAGSAKAILKAGSKAIATSSWSIAEAHGYRDGEEIPIGLLEQIVRRIAATIDAPVSVDFEGGYTEDDGLLAEHVYQLISLGIVGINFEDRIVKGQGLYSIERQARRIAVIRDVARSERIPLFINARTDLFLGPVDDTDKVMREALRRSQNYLAAGASGFFVPGLSDEGLIRELCNRVALPVNVMITRNSPSVRTLARLGVARISFGPIPYLSAMKLLQHEATTHLLSNASF